jgi:beta-1,2-mannosidase
MKRLFCYFTCVLFAFSSSAQTKDWMLAPFIKQDDANPCLIPSNTAFLDPIRKTSVAWEEKDVFNPAAVVRNGKVYLLYRAQDKIGKPAGT